MATSGERAQVGSAVASTVQTVANPAAGAEWTFAFTSTKALIAVTAVLATSATVANRQPILQITDNGGHVIAQTVGASPQTAGQTWTYSFFPGATQTGANGRLLAPIPPNIVVATNWSIQTVGSGLQAGDQWSGIVLTFAG